MARRALGPATLVAVRAVSEALTAPDERLVVACSGGPDSLALAAATVHAGRRSGRTVGAVVVDHGLQPGSDTVARRAADQLSALGLADVELRAAEVERGSGQGPEAAARTARYAVLHQVAAERAATVLVGHTLDDQAETVLLGLARGSGARSLAGMAARTPPVLRPFLGLRRDLLRTVCAEAGVEPWSDPHNVDPRFARVRVRTSALVELERSLGPGVAEALARTARLLRDDADLLDALAAEASSGPTAEECSEAGAEPGLACAPVLALPPALRRRVLRRWLLDAGAADLGLERVAAVERLLTHWHGQQAVDVAGVRVRRVGERLLAERR